MVTAGQFRLVLETLEGSPNRKLDHQDNYWPDMKEP